MLQQVYFQQFSLTRVHCGPGSDDNEGILCIPQSSSITGTSQSDYLVSHPRHSMEESYPIEKMQSV